MALTISSQISNLIATALEAITIANGSTIDVSSVYRPTSLVGINRTPPGSYVIQMIEEDPEVNEELSIPGNPPLIAWNQGYILDLIYRPSDSATVPVQQILQTFWGEVVEATMSDPQWSELAIDTNYTAPQWNIDDTNGANMFTAIFTVTLRHPENDPYTATP